MNKNQDLLVRADRILDAAILAYRFGATSYTYSAMMECPQAQDLISLAVFEAPWIEEFLNWQS